MKLILLIITCVVAQVPLFAVYVQAMQTKVTEIRVDGRYYTLYIGEKEMSKEDMITMRDNLFSRDFEDLQPEEQYNAMLLDYCLDYRPYFMDMATAMARPRYFGQDGFPLNKPITRDLNGDGKEEIITVTAMKEAELQKAMEEAGEEYIEGGLIVKINDLEIVYLGASIVDGFDIMDIDDNVSVVVISDEGPSGDYSSNLYAYDGKKIISGHVDGGLYQQIGYGTIPRMSYVLHQWLYQARYELTSEHLLRRVPEAYRVDYDIFVLKDMPLYTERNEASPTIQMKRGTIVTLIALYEENNKEGWVQVRLPNHRKGWLKVNGYQVHYKDTKIDADEIFHGLAFLPG